MRHTKIIATIGPSCHDDATLGELVADGVDVFRLNFSHGSHEDHAAMCRRVRAAAARAGRTVAVLQDLSGPKIRTGRLAGGQPLDLDVGDRLVIATGDFVGAAGRVSTSYSQLAHAARPGDRLLLDDGRIELRVDESRGTELVTTVVNGGSLGEHKGINAPGVPLPPSALTPKDLDDLKFGLELSVDLVALSFVRTAGDLRSARDALLAGGGGDVPLVAKIERPEAIADIEAILHACDAVMVARGDLGLELPLERVPRVQKEITRLARSQGVPVIVATQVFDSMRTEPRPTRAEVNDAANAVDDGVDAIMLTGETAVGAFPIRAVQTLDAVIRDAEEIPPPAAAPMLLTLPEAAHARALCEAAITLARHSQAGAIVAVTRGGKTARLLSALRPRATIYAATDNDTTARRLALLWGVIPFVSDIPNDASGAIATVESYLSSRDLLASGSTVVFVSVSPDLTRGDANFLRLRRLP